MGFVVVVGVGVGVGREVISLSAGWGISFSQG